MAHLAVNEVLFFYGGVNGAAKPSAARYGPFKAHWATGPGLSGCTPGPGAPVGCPKKHYPDVPLLFNVAVDPSEAYALTENNTMPTDPNLRAVVAFLQAAYAEEVASLNAYPAPPAPDSPSLMTSRWRRHLRHRTPTIQTPTRRIETNRTCRRSVILAPNRGFSDVACKVMVQFSHERPLDDQPARTNSRLDRGAPRRPRPLAEVAAARRLHDRRRDGRLGDLDLGDLDRALTRIAEVIGADPATASTIFLTMVTDSISFLIFLGAAAACPPSSSRDAQLFGRARSEPRRGFEVEGCGLTAAELVLSAVASASSPGPESPGSVT